MNKQEAHRLLIIKGKEQPIIIYYELKGLRDLVECSCYSEAIEELGHLPDYAKIILEIGELTLN